VNELQCNSSSLIAFAVSGSVIVCVESGVWLIC